MSIAIWQKKKKKYIKMYASWYEVKKNNSTFSMEQKASSFLLAIIYHSYVYIHGILNYCLGKSLFSTLSLE